MLAYDMVTIDGELTWIFRKVCCDRKEHDKRIESKSWESNDGLAIVSKKLCEYKKTDILLRRERL